jgi:hypothetical protein
MVGPEGGPQAVEQSPRKSLRAIDCGGEQGAVRLRPEQGLGLTKS